MGLCTDVPYKATFAPQVLFRPVRTWPAWPSRHGTDGDRQPRHMGVTVLGPVRFRKMWPASAAASHRARRGGPRSLLVASVMEGAVEFEALVPAEGGAQSRQSFRIVGGSDTGQADLGSGRVRDLDAQRGDQGDAPSILEPTVHDLSDERRFDLVLAPGDECPLPVLELAFDPGA